MVVGKSDRGSKDLDYNNPVSIRVGSPRLF